MYTCAVATADGQRLYASTSDGKIKELEEVSGTGMQITKEFDTGCTITCLLLPTGIWFISQAWVTSGVQMQRTLLLVLLMT
jgi:hypothetical protein